MERGHAGLLVLSALLVLSSPHVTCQQSAGDPCSLRSDGSRGVCRLISDCPSAEEVRMRGRPPTCGFSGFMPIVCCGTQSTFNSFNSAPNSFNTAPNSFNTAPNSFNTAPNSFNTAPNSGSSNSNRRRENGAVSKRMCEQYSRAVTHTLSALPLLPDPEPIPVLVPNCSLYQTPLIVGGEEARPGEFPHMVAVGYPLENQQLQWACGGTLISDRYVVTAAHCSYNKFANSPPTVARLGAHSLTQREEALWTDVPISGVEMHPDYKVSSRYNDIALLRLQRTVTFTSSIRPACLWTEERLPYKNATATGWGRIGSGEETSDVLMKTQLELVETPACRRRLQPSRRFEEGVIATQLCAGGGANDTCQGDSGGPLVVSSQDNWCVFYLVGVTSFGARCGAPIPAVYTRVSAFLPWLEGLVWPGN